MGNYNPNAPQILGQEWVSIRNEDTTFSPTVNSIEVGHTFQTATPYRLSTARVYINDIPTTVDDGQLVAAAIYATGTEDQSGPVYSVTLPIKAVVVTGGSISGGTSSLAVLSTPADDGIFFQPTLGTVLGVRASFDLANYPHLSGKRILNVQLLSAGSTSRTDTNIGIIVVTPDISVGPIWTDMLSLARWAPPSDDVVVATDIGEINYWWNGSPTANSQFMPWRYADLQRFDATAQRLYVLVVCGNSIGGVATADDFIYVQYLAMRVFYCEEKRLAVGSVRLGQPQTGLLELSGVRSQLGALPITLRDPLTLSATPTLAAGDYVVTASSPNSGASNFSSLVGYPSLNAARELYTNSPHVGTQVNLPFPLVDHIGDTFTSEVTHILPQLTLHATGGTMVEPHVYGRSIAAQVYGANTATQEIWDDISGAAASYPQVRFYARRFGDTTISLTLTGTASLAASTVSITPGDFDALVEILDGWKEITLRFAAPPTMGTLTSPEPAFTWSATTETAGNRWEILGASAPAISGVPGNLYNLVPSPNQLYVGTYQPNGGAVAELNWMPQGVASPYVTGPLDDDATDAVLIFSQDPPTVTGVTLTARTQTVTGFALDCGSLPCCIPTGIAYQQVAWSAVDVEETALSLPGAAGSYASTPDAASLDLTGDFTLTVDVTLTNWVPSAIQTFIGKSNTPSDRGYWFRLDTSGALGLLVSNNGTSFQVNALSTALPAPSSEGRLAVRASFDADNGAAGSTVTFSTAPTAAGPFTTLGASVVTAGVMTVFNSAAPLEVGTVSVGTVLPLSGYVRSATVVNNVGTTVANPNFSAQPAGTTSFVDTATPPKTWTLNGTAAIVTVSSAAFGYELQRFDVHNASGDFETIMLDSDGTALSFNDYEARVGITSVYRVRSLNALNFVGQWSAMVSGSPPTPGITGGCSDNTGALIFTSNADQTGAHNAAYVMQWEGLPTEAFQLPEADMVTYQPMYGRDGSIAFHGTERGLETFDRTVLLHAGAISPIRLADARTIRDLAWDDLPYVCVRDDIGDRWFSSVRVPAVNARLNRTNYMARIEIVETTQTPYAVDP